jgi:hypothetical protein
MHLRQLSEHLLPSVGRHLVCRLRRRSVQYLRTRRELVGDANQRDAEAVAVSYPGPLRRVLSGFGVSGVMVTGKRKGSR